MFYLLFLKLYIYVESVSWCDAYYKNHYFPPVESYFIFMQLCLLYSSFA